MGHPCQLGFILCWSFAHPSPICLMPHQDLGNLPQACWNQIHLCVCFPVGFCPAFDLYCWGRLAYKPEGQPQCKCPLTLGSGAWSFHLLVTALSSFLRQRPPRGLSPPLHSPTSQGSRGSREGEGSTCPIPFNSPGRPGPGSVTLIVCCPLTSPEPAISSVSALMPLMSDKPL